MAEPILEVSGLGKRFGGFVALENINIIVQTGERLGLIGPNGSGKSTLVNCLSGTLHHDSGNIVFDGRRLDGMPAYQRTRLGLARSFQLPKPFRELARAVASAPRLLFADESMAGLSPSEVEEILVVLFRLNEAGITIVLIEHIMRAVMSFSTRLVVLVAGQKIADGAPQEAIRDPEVERAYLGE